MSTYGWLYHVLRAGYAVIPIVYAAVLFNRAYRFRSREARRALISTTVGALVLGGAMSLVFAVAVGARPRADQVLQAGLFFFAILVVLKGLDATAIWAAGAIFRTGGPASGPEDSAATAPSPGASRLQRLGLAEPEPEPPGTSAPAWRRAAAGLLRTGLLAGLGLPYVMATVMTYRPKVAVQGDPRTEYGWAFEPVTFPAADRSRVSGWWVPAPPVPSTPAGTAPEREPEWGRRTALVLHGLGANKLNQIHMGRVLRARGYNLLAIDFRAHGASAGQFSSFGDKERYDVLGALAYLKRERSGQAREVVGVATSLGAAALIAATGSARRDEPTVDGIILYGTYADFGALATDVAYGKFPPPVDWLARRIAVPLAGAHAGVDLTAFRPRDFMAALGPRPVVILHGRADEIIPFRHGEALFDAAAEPKLFIPLEGGHNDIIEDEPAARRAADFVERHLAVRVEAE